MKIERKRKDRSNKKQFDKKGKKWMVEISWKIKDEFGRRDNFHFVSSYGTPFIQAVSTWLLNFIWDE